MMGKYILCVVDEVYNEASDYYEVVIEQALQVFDNQQDAEEARDILDALYGYRLRVMRPEDLK